MSEIKSSELILNPDGSVYHLNLKPEHIAHDIIFVGDQNRVEKITKFFDSVEFSTQKREFKTQTGTLKGKRITVMSTGIGPDNIDIVMNELDALVNIDLETRQPKETLTKLNIIRIGTSGSLQADIPVDSFVMSKYGLGLDNMLRSYLIDDISEKDIEEAFISQTDWDLRKGRPYVVACSEKLEKHFPEFSRLLRIFASPQIKNSATLVGNMMNASPIADSIPFLKSADARVHLLSPKGERVVDINELFLPGYKQMNLLPQELVTHISLPIKGLEFKLYKVSKRKDLDISAVTLAIGFELKDGKFTRFQLSLGGVAASVLRLKAIESSMLNTSLDEGQFIKLFHQIDPLMTPQSDVRGSSDYRRLLVRNLLLKFFHEEVEGRV